MGLKFTLQGQGAWVCLGLPVTYLLCDLWQVPPPLCGFTASVSYESFTGLREHNSGQEPSGGCIIGCYLMAITVIISS